MKKLQKRLRVKSTPVIIILLGLAVLVVFFSVWVVPLQKSISSMDVKIAELKKQLEIEKRLMPLYIKLKSKSTVDLPNLYFVPEKKELPRYQIEEVLPTFARIAEETDMAIVSIDPDIIGLGNKPGLMEIDVVIQGDFINFRNFLIEIARIPYLEQIGEIKVERVVSSLKFGMKILLAVS
jgi:hypothetical protein